MGCKQSKLNNLNKIENEQETGNNETNPKRSESEKELRLRDKKGERTDKLYRESVPAEGQDVDEEEDKDEKLAVIEKDVKSKKLIREAFLSNEFLNYLVNDERMRRIIDVMYPRQLESNSFLIKEGEIGSHLYVSASGSFKVIDSNNKPIKTIEVGEAFGELAILYSVTRQASVKVLCQSKVWVLDRAAFYKIVEEVDIKAHEENMKFLQACLLFQSIPPNVLSEIANLVQTEFFKFGAVIVQQGNAADKFYIIKAGNATITRVIDGIEKCMGSLSSGEYFGEIALQRTGGVRQATITALDSGVECLTLDRESFVKYLGSVDEFNGQKYNKKSTDAIDSDKKSNTEYACIQIEDLKLVHKIQSGSCTSMELVQFKTNVKLTFILKKIHKIDVINQLIKYEHVIKEKDILMNSRSHFIRSLYRTYQDKRYLYFLLEPCLGGNLWSLLERKGQFNETTAIFMSACVIEALEHLHDQHYIYRDLKPENLMMDSRGYIKLVDFTSAKCLIHNSKTWSFVGTLEYLAPEVILNRGHNQAVDIWALGIFIHELLVGYTPFRDKDPLSTYNNILKGIDKYIFSTRISSNAQNLITKLCHPVSRERLGSLNGFEEVRQHGWYNDFNWKALREGTLVAPLINSVKNNQDIQHLDIVKLYDDEPPEVDNWMNF